MFNVLQLHVGPSAGFELCATELMGEMFSFKTE